MRAVRGGHPRPDGGGGREELGRFWGGASRSGSIEALLALADGSGPEGVLGVNVSEGGESSYRIAVASSGEAPGWADEIHVPAGTWAVFDCTGPCDVATAEHYRRIFSEWLPSSGYECLWSNKAVRCRHLFWTVMAFILDSVGGRHRCDMRAPVPLVS